MDRLKRIDERMHNAGCSERIDFSGEIRGSEYYWQINQRFCIHKWMMESGDEAVIYGIVTAYYVVSEFQESGWTRSRLLHRQPRKAYSKAAAWLAEHNFIDVYVDQLRDASR